MITNLDRPEAIESQIDQVSDQQIEVPLRARALTGQQQAGLTLHPDTLRLRYKLSLVKPGRT